MLEHIEDQKGKRAPSKHEQRFHWQWSPKIIGQEQDFRELGIFVWRDRICNKIGDTDRVKEDHI